MANLARPAELFSKPLMNVVRLASVPILQLLRFEERIFRTSSDNWCIVNDGTNSPTIVMGISGKPSELIELEPVIRDRVPVIKRFTGGGTVIVDARTIFVTFICNKDAIPGLRLYPRDIMSWTGQLYGNVFRDIHSFHLRENDYAFDDRKFGGNAQSITKGRWLHHTSFLWDYELRNMEYLKVPLKAPTYRLERNHADFICPMKDYFCTRGEFIDQTIASLGNFFNLKHVLVDTDANPASAATYNCTTRLMAEQELEADLAVQQMANQESENAVILGSS